MSEDLRTLTAGLLVVGEGCALRRGRLVWDRLGVIRAVEPAPSTTRLDAKVVTAGLINAHLHGQIGPLPEPVTDFVPWLRAVLANRASQEEGGPASILRRHLCALLHEGCTAVGEIDSLGVSWGPLSESGLAGRCYRELVGFDLRGDAAAQRVATAQDSVSPGALPSRIAPGLSPHAPYSVSPDLLSSAAKQSAAMTVHIEESEEELQFFRSGRGPMRSLLEDLGRLPSGYERPAARSGVEWLAQAGALRASTSLVHCQGVDAEDAQRIARSGASIVVCPGTIEYFDRRPPPVERWRALGIPVAIGTDSVASSRGDRCSMRRELARAARLWPSLAPAAVLDMATAQGARALAHPGLGTLQVGKAADFVCWDAVADADLTSAAASIVGGEATTASVWVAGRQELRDPS